MFFMQSARAASAWGSTSGHPIRGGARLETSADTPTLPRATVHPMMNAVGGTSLHYWAQSWRLNPWDFRVVSETTRRYGASRLPKGTTVEDWPFGIEELLARIRVALRHATQAQGSKTMVVTAGPLMVDLAGHRVTRARRP